MLTLAVPGQHPDWRGSDTSGPPPVLSMGYLLMNSMVRSIDKFFSFFSRIEASERFVFTQYHTRSHGRYRLVDTSFPSLCS